MAFTKKQWEEWKKANPEKWKERSKKIAAAHKGRSIHDSHKAAISASMKGRKLSDAHRKRISAAMKKARSSKSNKAPADSRMFHRLKLTTFVLLVLLIFAFIFGFTNLGLFVAAPSNFELYSNLSVGSDAEIVSEHVVFGDYKPEYCSAGVLVYREGGVPLGFVTTNEVYIDSTCSEVDVHFNNVIYEEEGFSVQYVNPTPRIGSVSNVGDIQIRVKTNKAAEFALLEFLLRKSSEIVSKETIINHVWDYDADILPNTVEVFIGYLRKKIDKPFPKDKKLIKTVRGFGYKVSL